MEKDFHHAMRLEYSTDYSAPADPGAWASTDETLVRPVAPGEAIVRLAQVSGGLQRHAAIAALLPQAAPSNLQKHRAALLDALESGNHTRIAGALHEAQDELRRLYISLCRPLLEDDLSPESAAERLAQLAALGFPDPRVTDAQPVDVATVITTFSLIRGQVVTTLHFQEAPAATAYWLHEVRYFDDERLEDAILESPAPLFPRVRLALGKRHLRIKSRNAHTSVISEEFTITVPDLT